MSSASAAFTATEAITAGEWDRHLEQVLVAVRSRLMVLQNESAVPPRTAEMIASGHQVWVWMQGPGKPHWEVRGTGAIIPDELRRKP